MVRLFNIPNRIIVDTEINCDCKDCRDNGDAVCNPDNRCEECPGCNDRYQERLDRDFDERNGMGWYGA